MSVHLMTGDMTGDPRIERLVLDHLSLADSLARHYRCRGEESDDLIQVARLGLIQAARRYQPQRGPFPPYASATIGGEIKRHFRDHAWLVRPSRGSQELITRIGQTSESLHQQLHRAPAVSEIAAEVDCTPARVRDAILARGGYDGVSLDEPGPTGSESLADRLGEREQEYDRVEVSLIIGRAVARLPREERDILHQRFVLGRSQADIAARLGVTQMTISRRLARILAALRADLTGADDSGTPNGRAA